MMVPGPGPLGREPPLRTRKDPSHPSQTPAVRAILRLAAIRVPVRTESYPALPFSPALSGSGHESFSTTSNGRFKLPGLGIRPLADCGLERSRVEAFGVLPPPGPSISTTQIIWILATYDVVRHVRCRTSCTYDIVRVTYDIVLNIARTMSYVRYTGCRRTTSYVRHRT